MILQKKNYKELRLLAVKFVYKNVTTQWVIKNIKNWFEDNLVENERGLRAYDSIAIYVNTSFSQKFVFNHIQKNLFLFNF